MANETPSSETVDFALVEQLGIDIVAKALSISADAVRKWRPRGVPKGRQAAIAELARSKQSPSTESPGGWISSMRNQLTQPGDDDEAPASAWDDDDEGADQAHATEASTPMPPADERGPTPAAEPATVVRDQRSRSAFRSSVSGVTSKAVPPTVVQETRKPVRLNRKAVLTVSGGLAAAIVVGLAHGMTQVGGSTATTPAEADDEPVYQPLGNAVLPKFDYTNLPQQAALTVVTEPPKEEPEPEPAEPVVTQTRAVAAAPARDRNAEEEEAALQSPLFPGGAGSARAAAPAPGALSTDATLAALDRLRSSLPTPQDLTPQGQGQPSVGSQQESFLNAQLDEAIYLKNGLQKPLSDFEVKAGTIIPAALITGLNSDLPGEIIGQVTEHVYDTSSGQHLLIPQGAKIFGRYNLPYSERPDGANNQWRKDPPRQ